MEFEKGNLAGHLTGSASRAVLMAVLMGIVPGAAFAQSDASDQGGSMETVVVSGMRESLKNARDMKENASSIVDSIVAEDIGKLPDQNIAEAAERIPGIQIEYDRGEGASVAIRGITQTKMVLNGQELFGGNSTDYNAGEYNGRDFDLQDLPADVISSVEVHKTSSANQIEGGLGGYINVVTRKPFDFSGLKVAVSAKATSYDLGKSAEVPNKIRGLYSVLVSDRTHTALGDVGLLVNVSYGESTYSEGSSPTWQPPALVSNYAGSGTSVIDPSGVYTGRGKYGNRQRLAGLATLEWAPTSDLTLHLDVYGIDYSLRGQFETERFATGTPTTPYTLFSSGDELQSGTFTDSGLNSAAAFQDEFRKTWQYVLGGEWNDGGPLSVKFAASHTTTNTVNTLDEWGMAANIPTMTYSIVPGGNSQVAVSGTDLLNPHNYTASYLLAIELNGNQKNTVGTIDATYDLGHLPFLKSVDFGGRYADYTRHSYGYIDFYSLPSVTADNFGSFVTRVPSVTGDFIGWDVGALRQKLAMRSYFGLPAQQTYTPDQDLLYNEKTAALYAKANFAFDAFGTPVTGDFGMRYVHTGLTTAGYALDNSSNWVLEKTGSNSNVLLPSMNTVVRFTDDLQLRIGASKTMGRVPFEYLNGALIIDNPVLHDAHAGNPNLSPYRSTNVDFSLEYYFGTSGELYGGLFYKDVHGFVQTISVPEVLNGVTYSVSTYQQASASTIRGVELGYQQFFDFLPAPFDGLGTQVNYTYVDSRAPSSITGTTTPLEALSKNSANVVAMYEKDAIKVRLAYGWRSGYLKTTNSSGAYGVPVYNKDLGVLDLSVSYDVNDHLTVTADGTNLTGSKIGSYYNNVEQTTSWQSIGKRFGLQVRYSY